MTKIVSLLLMMWLPSVLSGQAIKKIKNKEQREVFYVLKEDNTTKHGEYKKFSNNNKLLLKGYYKNGVKDSIWEAYDFDGKKILVYSYTQSQLIFFEPIDHPFEGQYKIIDSEVPDTAILSRPPVYLRGQAYLKSEILQNVRYPAKAAETGQSGQVDVIFTVDKSGKAGNHHVKQSIGYGLDEESVRVVQLLPDEWLPGLVDGKPVDVEITIPVTFKLFPAFDFE